MKKPQETELTTVYGALMGNVHSLYSKLTNVRPVRPPYSETYRPNRFFLQTRPGREDRSKFLLLHMLDGTVENYKNWSDDNYGQFTDIIKLVGDDGPIKRTYEYRMWISGNKSTIRIFKSKDGCDLHEIYNDCFCGCGFEYFIPVNFVKGKPKPLFMNEDGTVISQGSNDQYHGTCGTQFNNPFCDQGNALAGLETDFVDGEDAFWQSQGGGGIKTGDYLYTYSTKYTCITDDTRQGICGQVNRIVGVDKDDKTKLNVANYWNGFDPGQIRPEAFQNAGYYFGMYGTYNGLDDSFYARPPQRYGDGMEYMIFPEMGDTFAFQTCEGIKTFHYHDHDFNGGEAVVTNMCNFSGCYGDAGLYTGSNGTTHLTALDTKHSVILYSDGGNLSYLGAQNTVKVRGNTYGMTSFQNYVIYFGSSHIGAFYINQQADASSGVNRWIANGNIIRENMGFWINPNGKVTAYDEFDNSFYFMGSNGRIYSLSLGVNEGGMIESQLQDMSISDWAKPIYGELMNIDKSQYVRIKANDDTFRIFISGNLNHNGSKANTKILTYHKQYQIRTVDNSCAVIISNELEGVCKTNLFGDSVYEECGIKDGEGVSVGYNIEMYLGEDEDHGIQGMHSFNMKNLQYIKTQIGNQTRAVDNDSRIEIRGYKNGIKLRKTIPGLFQSPYLQMLQKIEDGEEIEVSQCLLDNLQDCEEYVQECKGSVGIIYDDMYDIHGNPIFDSDSYFTNSCNGYQWRPCLDGCSCVKPMRVKDACFCYDDKQYYMSPFNNLYTRLDMKAEMYKISYRGHDTIQFGGMLLGIYLANSPKETWNCNKWMCDDCSYEDKEDKDTQGCFG